MTRHLPAELTTFVGRRQELAEGRRMLRAARLVTLVGTGGVGKTRLAQRLARQVEGVFPDGVVMVELAGHQDAASLLSVLAAAIEVDTRGAPADEAVVSYLANRRFLLVLDNCEHLIDACADLVDAMLNGTTNLRVLATSRQPLGLAGEHLMAIDPLAVPTADELAQGAISHGEAVTLFTDRARAIDPAFRVDGDNMSAVARLCQRLDGIPLAIELAARRLRILSIAQLADRLDDRFATLSSGARSAPERHQTLRSLIDWSHGLCSPEEQALWARMSVFDGGAEFDALEAACAEPGESVVEALAGLVDKSVVSLSGNGTRARYRMLETIREYGTKRLAELGQAALTRDRHRDHYLALARESRAAWIGPDQAQWMARVTADLDNLRGAFEHSLADPRDRTNALDLASSLVWYWPRAGATDEGSRWFAKAVADPEEPSPLLLRGLVAAIFVASERGDEDTALPLAQRAASLAHSRHNAADDAAHHMAVATEALLTGEYETAAMAYETALVRYQSAGDDCGQLECLVTLALLAQHLGHQEDALPRFDQAVRLCDARGESSWRTYLLYARGALLWDLGRPVEAVAEVTSSLESWSILDPVAIAGALLIVAWAQIRAGHERRGAVLLGARHRIREDLGALDGPFRASGRYAVSDEEVIKAIGEDEFRRAHDEGFALSTADAVQLALGDNRTVTTPGAWPRRLSKRERQVAELLARGRTNKEIAAELVISQRTAEGHVAKIMDKLGVSSRAQVAVWVTEESASQE